ncbi:Fatty acid synthase [Araneus ventricosus]|uniref:Fatty acid synthase n=1 Tax=Araneus ventricosus TaxID=182803 RepID=A0A4Y2KFN3_ARAVE|nr:Fatty acid synthase [Araneus ventricosus]
MRLYGLPRKTGKLKDISKFDSQYFGIHHKQAHVLDPQARILLEVTHECIVDAGYDSEELRGRNVGVFIGNSISESEEFFCSDAKRVTGYSLIGCCRAMFANRISYTFDFKGSSFLMDTACSSGAVALYEAVRAIQNNECEAAIVGAANLCLRPATSLQFYKLNMLSEDGVCKSFDAAGNGFGRSEAVVALLLQKSNVARRKYATIVHIKTNTDGFKEQGATFPSAELQKRLIKEVYDECKLNPLKVCYVEAHGTGTPAGDPVEMSAISEIFCPGREEPLLVGSVKTNMGHSEATSGLCSLVKLIISMEKSLIPPNLHFYKPNPNIKALVDGQVRIVTNPTPYIGDYAAISCFGFGGVNVHAILKSNTIERKPKEIEEMPMPQLALYSGRTEEGVQYVFDYLQNEVPPREFFALLHKSVYSSSVEKPYRGYKLLLKDEEVSEIKKLTSEHRPIWYIFSGMGTQWPCMAKQLMNLEVFARSIRRSSEVLKPYGLDLTDIVTNGGKIQYNSRNIISVFVSIAAVQVALVDVLNEIGIIPDGIIGHSIGELGCAYVDGSLTADQILLVAYGRGKALEDSNLETGAMAALGITWSEANKCCPKGIFPSCHNAEDSVTISGPKDSVKVFVDALKAENVFVREVDSYGYAFHSQYILPAVRKLQTYLEKVIPKPKPRTSRWISSCYPKEEWDDSSAKLAGPSYFLKNFVSPVLFHEALLHVPKDAIVIEIAPHHLLQAILKRAIGPHAEYVGLMKRNVDNTIHLLSSLGRLYTAGLNPDIEKLYPQVQFPVPKGTPMISPLIKWDHSESWCVPKWDKNTNRSQMITEVNVGSDESPDKYILDHRIDGRCLYPATGYLVLVWKALAEMKGKDVMSLPVTFEEVKIHRAAVLCIEVSTKFLVDITNSGEFEISEGGITVCTGRIYFQEESVKTDASELLKSKDLKSLSLKQSDIYKELKLKGYDYGPAFQGLVKADLEGNKGLLKWTGDWVVFLDTMLQVSILGSPKRALCLPTRIQNIKIDPILQKTVVNSALKEYNGLPVFHEKNTKRIISGGVEFKHLKTSVAPRNQGKQIPLLEEYRFIPYSETKILSKSDEETLGRYIYVCSSLAKTILELSGKKKDQIYNVLKGFEESDELIMSYLKSYTDNHVLLKSLSGIINTATSKDLTRHVKNYVNSYLSERDNDILSQTMLQENPLRTVMDVVLENAAYRRLKVLEIAETSVPFSTKISECAQNFGVLNINYLIAHSTPDLLEKSNLPSGNFELSSWDPKSALTFKDVPDDHDLCVMKFLNHPSKELRKIIENVMTTLNGNGFVLLLQRTRLVLAERILSAVGETVLPIHAESDLEQTFKDLNLQVICKKSDSLTSTMYLLRKSADISYEDIVIPVIEDKYERWVDDLSEQMTVASMSSDPKRIWLVSEAYNSGIIGLVNCLRQEPGGSSIRCVFASEGTPKLPEFTLKNQFYQDIAKKNLTMNVFKRGVWGTFRHLTMSEGNQLLEYLIMPRSMRIFKKSSGKEYKKSEMAVTQVQNLSPNGQSCAKERKIPNIDVSFSAENTGKGVLNSIIGVNILARVFKNFVNCKNCNSDWELQVLKSTSGLAVSFILNCFQCEYTKEISSSEFHEGTQIATVNTRYVYALCRNEVTRHTMV